MNSKYIILILAILMIKLEALERSFSDELDRGLASLCQSSSDESDVGRMVASGWGTQSIYKCSSTDSESNRETVECADKGVQTESEKSETAEEQEATRFNAQVRFFLCGIMASDGVKRNLSLEKSRTLSGIGSSWAGLSPEARERIKKQYGPLRCLLAVFELE